MNKNQNSSKTRPLLWGGLAVIILATDYLTGPFVSFPILYLVPVTLAARYNGRIWGISLAAAMPLAHFAFSLLWPVPWSVTDSVLSCAIRIAVLVTVAFLVDRVTRQALEIRVLRGLLPVCAFCKRIRTESQQWQQMEVYITEHSEARFSHTFCPECARKHYGDVVSAQVRDSGTTPQ